MELETRRTISIAAVTVSRGDFRGKLLRVEARRGLSHLYSIADPPRSLFVQTTFMSVVLVATQCTCSLITWFLLTTYRMLHRLHPTGWFFRFLNEREKVSIS